jgi:hypothetical protein
MLRAAAAWCSVKVPSGKTDNRELDVSGNIIDTIRKAIDASPVSPTAHERELKYSLINGFKTKRAQIFIVSIK